MMEQEYDYGEPLEPWELKIWKEQKGLPGNPCPICGKADFKLHGVLESKERGIDHDYYFIRCQHCGYTTDEYLTRWAAVAAWDAGHEAAASIELSRKRRTISQ